MASDDDSDGGFVRMSSSRCEDLWYELAAVYCKRCVREYGEGNKFASVCLCLPGNSKTEMMPTQDLYLVNLKCLGKTSILHPTRATPLVQIDKHQKVIPFMHASWKYNEQQVYSLDNTKNNKIQDYGFTVIRHGKKAGEVHRVIVTAVSQCLCALQKHALEHKLFGPFDSFELGLTDSANLTATDEPPLNPMVFFEREDEKIHYRSFLEQKKNDALNTTKGKKVVITEVSSKTLIAPFLS